MAPARAPKLARERTQRPSVKFDNSDIQSDYFDRHASLSQDFAVLIVKRQAEKEALARRALALCPDLKDFKWTWHTEKWSMGHGNYLESDGFDLPLELQGLRKRYMAGDITCAHWEIEFTRCYSLDRPVELDAYKTFGIEEPVQTDRSQVAAITLVVNDARQGLELHFPDKPSDAILDEIRAANTPVKIWRFHFVKRMWYTRNTPEAKAWAEAFVARHTTTHDKFLATMRAPHPTTPEPAEAPETPIPAMENKIIPVDFEITPAANVPLNPPVPVPITPSVPSWRRRTTI